MLSEKGNAFVRPLVNKGFKEERVTTMRLDNLGKSTPLESNKSLPVERTEGPARQLWPATLASPLSTRRRLMVSLIIGCFYSRRQLLGLAEGGHRLSFLQREGGWGVRLFLLGRPACECLTAMELITSMAVARRLGLST